MGDIAQRGNRLTFARGGGVRHLGRALRGNKRIRGKDSKTHGRDVPTMAAKGGRIGKFGGGRTNLLEELGRVEAEPSNRNRRAEISRVHGELNRGYAKGGRAGFQDGKKVDITTEKFKKYYEGKVDYEKILKDPKKRKKYQEHWDKAEKNKQKRLAIEAMKPEDAGYAEGGRIGLKKGKMPWGVGPKPGTLEHFQHTTQTPKRKRKAIGGVLKAARILGKKFKKKKVYPETEDLTHQVGPYAGDVGSEGKRRTMGPKGKGKSPGRPQAPGPKGRRPWRGAIPG